MPQIPTAEDTLSIQHQDWLRHPITRQMLEILEKQKQFNVKAISGQAGNTQEDAFFHRVAMTIKALDSVKEWTTNTEKFVQQLVK